MVRSGAESGGRGISPGEGSCLVGISALACSEQRGREEPEEAGEVEDARVRCARESATLRA